MQNSFYNKDKIKNNIRLRNKADQYSNKRMESENIEYMTHNQF